MRPKTKPDPEKKRADIMSKAVKLFLAKGFDATSTNDICLTAKLTKPSLYHYFESKNHLLFSVHMHAIQTILQPYMENVMSIKEPDKRLQTMIREYTKQICSHPELQFILHGSLMFKDKYFARIKEEWRKHHRLVRETIAELQSAGRINKKLDPSRTALLLLGMITWITFWFDYKRKDKIEEIADLTVEIAFHGVGLDI
jgi:AcrR family transcriptional regulator